MRNLMVRGSDNLDIGITCAFVGLDQQPFVLHLPAEMVESRIHTFSGPYLDVSPTSNQLLFGGLD